METALLLLPQPFSVFVAPLLLQQPQPRTRKTTNVVIWMFLALEYLCILFWDFDLHLFKKKIPQNNQKNYLHTVDAKTPLQTRT